MPMTMSHTYKIIFWAGLVISVMALWGELEDQEERRETFVPIWTDKWRPSSVSCQVPYVASSKPIPSYQVTQSDSVLAALDHPKDSHDSNVILHSIELQQYIEEMRQLIASSVDVSSSLQNRESLKAPKPPTKYWNHKSLTRWDKPSACNPDSQTRLPGNIQLTDKTCHLLQRKGAATICLHKGYEASYSTALNVLSDVLGDFVSRLCISLKSNIDGYHRGVTHTQEGELDSVLEKTLHQFGLGGKRELRKYWETLMTEHSCLCEEAKEQVEEWKKTMGGNDAVKEREHLLKSMNLSLNKSQRKGSAVDIRLPSPWVANTPVLLGEEDTSISSDINLDNVMPLKTPDLAGTAFPQLSDSHEHDETLETLDLDSSPPRKRLRSSSFTNEN